MDLKTLDRQTRNKKLRHKLPQGNGNADPISTRIRGVLYRTSPETNHKATHFLLGLLDNASNIQHKSYNKEIGKVLKSSGRALEYFLIDFLQRNKSTNPISNRAVKINHRKGAFEQDTEDKIDFITTVTVGENKGYKHIRSGIQLTTADDPNHHKQEKQKTEHFKKKKHIVKISETQRKDIPKSYNPDIKGFMVVNGTLQKTIHKHKCKLFSQSFRKRRKDGFMSGGPGAYLPDDFFKELETVAKLYERSQYHMITNYILQKPRQKAHAVQEKENYYISIKHDLENNELIYEFFNKQESNDKYNFIFSITYFLT